MIIGITGPTGAGKSVVSEYLAEKENIYHIDADKVSRLVTEKGSLCLKEIETIFGREYINSDGTLNRRSLGEYVFSNKDALSKLNEITHKYIVDAIKKETEKHTHSLIDAPLLFETGLDSICDKIILVLCPEDIRIKRITERDGISVTDAYNRINNQKDYSEYIPKCNIVIENTDRESFIKQLERIEII